MFISEGWPEAAPELQLDDFVFQVLKALYDLTAPPFLSRSYLKALLTVADQVRVTQVPNTNDVLTLLRVRWRELDPEMLLMLQKTGGEPLITDE